VAGEGCGSLAAAVRGNTLTRVQRDQAALVLGMIGSALRTAAQAVEGADGDPASAAASVAGAWEPVGAPKRPTTVLAGTGRPALRSAEHPGGRGCSAAAEPPIRPSIEAVL